MRFLHGHGSTDRSAAIPVIFLPGWGFDGRVLQLAETRGIDWLSPDRPLDPATFQEEFAAALAEQNIDRFVLVGWSMGAYLALDFTRLHPEQVSALYLLAMRQSWPAHEIAVIRHDLRKAPQDFLAAFYRKCFLGHREAYRMFGATLESAYLHDVDLALLERGLSYLADVEGCQPPPELKIFQMHGCKDVIAPLAERACLEGVPTQAFAHVGHPVFLAREFQELISIHKLSPRKAAIRQRFSKAASTYDGHARTQKETALRLGEMLAGLEEQVTRVLEVGCGTGVATGIVNKYFPRAQILSLDFSDAMVEAASRKLAGQTQVRFLCVDAEEYLQTAKEQSFDLVVSNATLQWFDNIEESLAGIVRVLAPGGYCIASVFGPESLQELAQGLSHVRGHAIKIAAAGFVNFAQFEALLQENFSEVGLEEMRVVRKYDSLWELLDHMRRTGTTGGQLLTRPMLTRAGLQELDAWFIREKGGYALTHQVFLFRCRKEG
jgi:malonyl-CoA O-methyltransferase